MKTPSKYPVLDNRPIDQWKVTELKEELKRRKLTTKGLKDDLVRRLDEALRNELESIEEVNVNDAVQADPEPVVHADDPKAVADTPQPIVQTEDVRAVDGTPQLEAKADGEGETTLSEKIESTMSGDINAASKGTSGGESGKIEENVVLVTSVETKVLVDEVLPSEGKVEDGEGTGTDLVKTEENLADATSIETSVTVTQTVTHEVSMDVQETPKDDISVRDDLKTQVEGQKSGVPQDLEVKSSDVSDQVSEVSTSVSFQATQLEADAAKPPQDDVKLHSADPSNQVSEVNTVLGFQIKSDSISSDVSIIEKNELKDNIIDDNVKLEVDVKPEMVHPPSSNIISDEPHPMDVEEPGDKKEPVEEVDDRNANLDMTKKNDSIDVGLSEKISLDRSSGDDSMDDDIIENKPIDSKYNSEGVVDQGMKTEDSIMEEAPVVTPNDIPADKKDVVEETKKVPAAALVKRKLNDQEVGGNNEIKRQRRWNTGSIKVPEPQSNTVSSTTPKGTFPTPTLKRSFSRSDSTASKETPKERVVPPSPKAPTTSLRIDQFLRPFTLKAVQELLGKTGSVTSFWMDHIKTHCFVTYSSVEEAIETRNAVYNLQWPPNGGRHLLAEFVDPQEVKAKVEPPPPSPATAVAKGPSASLQPAATAQPPRQQVQRQQVLPPPPSLPPPPPLSNPPQARERLPPPPPIMEKMEKVDPPIVTLDDLFRKTKATPRIYYLPLSDEQVAEKRRKMKQ